MIGRKINNFIDILKKSIRTFQIWRGIIGDFYASQHDFLKWFSNKYR